MMIVKSAIWVLGLMLFASQANARDLTIVGTLERTIPLTHTNHSLRTTSESNSKTITLLEYELSEKAQRDVSEKIQQTLDRDDSNPQSFTATASKQKQLGMNNVPVLDQGQYGTCATFAVTAAVDAVIKKGDYISQLCMLQLGSYLSSVGQGPSGWDGLSSYRALDRLRQYGIVSLKKQRAMGCAGVKEYPKKNTPNTSMSIEEYAQQSEKSSGALIHWKTLFNKNTLNSSQKNSVDQVKSALDAGNRVEFGVLLPRADLGTMGAVGWHHYFSDTWVLTHDIAQEVAYQTKMPGHAMVVTGYDDDAVAMDRSGHRHHGLFTLRNSWGAYVADWGDFYMSYDYFNALATDGHQIQQTLAKI